MKKINFKNKTVVISGGGTGIGYQIAKSFLEAQAKVIILGRRKEVLQKSIDKLIKETKISESMAFYFKCDMSDQKSLSKISKEIKSKFKHIDIMINNSSTWSLEKISEMNINEIDYHFNNIFKSVILGTKFSSKLFGDSGSIINIGSFSGLLPMKNGSIYSALKSSIITFTRSSAQEFGSNDIRVNCIIPGVIRTPMTTKYIDENLNKIIEPIALNRIGKTTDVANATLFLSSDLSSYISGAVLEVTGGKYLTQL
tara:strand:+ start:1292 stop:2056 length:765 start_codon:yes stop_codon:yes gene_type:complete